MQLDIFVGQPPWGSGMEEVYRGRVVASTLDDTRSPAASTMLVALVVRPRSSRDQYSPPNAVGHREGPP